MKRREFIKLIGGAAATWPLAVNAQQVAKVPTIVFLGQLTPSAQNKWAAAFAQRLRELGWVEGRTVAIEYRWAEHASSASPKSRPSWSARERARHIAGTSRENMEINGEPVGGPGY